MPVSRRPAEGPLPYHGKPSLRFGVTVSPPASTPDLGAVGPSARLPARGEGTSADGYGRTRPHRTSYWARLRLFLGADPRPAYGPIPSWRCVAHSARGDGDRATDAGTAPPPNEPRRPVTGKAPPVGPGGEWHGLQDFQPKMSRNIFCNHIYLPMLVWRNHSMASHKAKASNIRLVRCAQILNFNSNTPIPHYTSIYCKCSANRDPLL